MKKLLVAASSLAIFGAVGVFASSAPASSPTGNGGTTTVACVVDNGVELPSSEPLEGSESASVTVTPTKLWPPNGKMHTIGLSMAFSDDESDTASLTVLSITSNQGTSADWSGVGNTASGPADGSTISTSVQLRAARDGTNLAGRTYSITLQCGEAGTPPQAVNTVTVQVTVPHDQGNNAS